MTLQPDMLMIPGQRVKMAGDDVQRLDRDARVLRIISGCAWVTLDGADFILKSGEQLILTPGSGKALISPLGHRILVYEIVRVEREIPPAAGF